MYTCTIEVINIYIAKNMSQNFLFCFSSHLVHNVHIFCNSKYVCNITEKIITRWMWIWMLTCKYKIDLPDFFLSLFKVHCQSLVDRRYFQKLFCLFFVKKILLSSRKRGMGQHFFYCDGSLKRLSEMSSCKPLTAAAFAISMMWWKSQMSRGRILG